MISHEPFNRLSNKAIGDDIFVKNDYGTMSLTNKGEIIFASLFLLITLIVYFISRFIFSNISDVYK